MAKILYYIVVSWAGEIGDRETESILSHSQAHTHTHTHLNIV